jgi:hypothetical protein
VSNHVYVMRWYYDTIRCPSMSCGFQNSALLCYCGRGGPCCPMGGEIQPPGGGVSDADSPFTRKAFSASEAPPTSSAYVAAKSAGSRNR